VFTRGDAEYHRPIFDAIERRRRRAMTTLATRRALLAMLLVAACKRSEGSAPPETKRYVADGIAFAYPKTMKLERGRKDMPFRTVIVRADRVFAMVGWTPRPVDNDQLRERAFSFARDRVLAHTIIDRQRSGAKVSRAIGGRSTEGAAVYGLDDGVMMSGEVYVLELAGTSVMLLLFYSERASKSERAWLEIVASSLGAD
jgi:hypothetical protein